jgi:SAM-dependent methyltransferase
MEYPVALAERQAERTNETLAASREEAVRTWLDAIWRQLLAGDSLHGMQSLIDELRDVRQLLTREEWRDLSAETILKHKIADALFQCPLTRRSNQKPRGYAGDAELLDHIYGLGAAVSAPHPASLAGQIYFYTVNSPACRAVRRRREILAEEIDAIAQRTAPRKAEILSIACGHLREIELTAAAAAGSIGRFVALDQDDESLSVIDNAYAAFGVEATKGTVRNIISKKIAFENFDFVYAAGLFDYLADPIAMRLIERMFGFLRPGGRMLIANFTPAGPDVGYMETFMDWWLILRTADDMRRLIGTIPKDEVSSVEVFEDEAGTIVYATVEKR